MLVAVFILFIGIVGLVLYLVVQSYSRGRSEQYDASSLVEEYANNRMITQQGDVVFCYRLSCRRPIRIPGRHTTRS